MGFLPTRFFDVGGIPVRVEAASGDGLSVLACDPAPRTFPSELVFRQGTEISRENFDQLVKSCGSADQAHDASRKRLWPDDESPREKVQDGEDDRRETRRRAQTWPAEDC